MAEKRQERRVYEGMHQAARQDDFALAQYSEQAAERSGFSNYSYWGSTFKKKKKNRGFP